jgi:hypothetical protein
LGVIELSVADFNGGKFVKMSDIVYKLAVADPSDKRMSLPWRIWEISLGRMNNWGHAGFAKDELASLILGKSALSRTERQKVWKYVKVLKDLGRIAPVSTSLCIVVRHDIVTRPRGKGGYDDLCCEPNHMPYRRMVWEPSAGWFDAETGITADGIHRDPWATSAA